jgi:hypothetical protein
MSQRTIHPDCQNVNPLRCVCRWIMAFQGYSCPVICRLSEEFGIVHTKSLHGTHARRSAPYARRGGLSSEQEVERNATPNSAPISKPNANRQMKARRNLERINGYPMISHLALRVRAISTALRYTPLPCGSSGSSFAIALARARPRSPPEGKIESGRVKIEMAGIET